MALVFTVAASPANAQSFVEIEKDGGTSAKALFEFLEDNTDSVPTGFFVYAQVPLFTDGESPEEPEPSFQVYGGFYAKPVPWVKFSMGFGGEAPGRARYGASFLLGGRENDMASSFTLYEIGGGSGEWYKNETTVTFGPVKPGVFAQKFVGVGPFVEVPLPHKFSITGGVGFGYGIANPIVSLRKILY